MSRPHRGGHLGQLWLAFNVAGGDDFAFYIDISNSTAEVWFSEGGLGALPCPGVLVLVTNFNGDARSHHPRTLYTLDGLFPAGRLFSGDQFWQWHLFQRISGHLLGGPQEDTTFTLIFPKTLHHKEKRHIILHQKTSAILLQFLLRFLGQHLCLIHIFS